MNFDEWWEEQNLEFTNNFESDHRHTWFSALTNQWVRVEDSLPNENECVIVKTSEGYAEAEYYYKRFNYPYYLVESWKVYKDVSHWMPIPPLPEE